MSITENKIIIRVKKFVIDHKPLCVLGVLYIVTVIVGLFYSPWQSSMVDNLVSSGGGVVGVSRENSIAAIFLPGSYDLLSFFFCYFTERVSNAFTAILGLLVLSIEYIIEKLITRKYSTDTTWIEKLISSFFSSNVIFSLMAYIFAFFSPLMESLPDLSNSIVLRIIALITLVLCVPVTANVIMSLCSFMLTVVVSAFLYVNGIPVFLICIVVFIVAIFAYYFSDKISDFIGRIIWGIIPFLRPLAELLKD